MADPLAEMFAGLLPERLPEPVAAEAYAPSNIALSKYWGKRDPVLNLPLNSSLSISLGTWGTTTQIGPSEQDRFAFNGEAMDLDAPLAARAFRFVDLFRQGQGPALAIDTKNTIPTAAGLASSASGFAALTLALDQTFGLGLDRGALSRMARVGSGSAARSLWDGFVRWDRGEKADGSDSVARRLGLDWPEFRIAIVAVDTGPKEQSSRDGMGHTAATSPLFPPWPDRAEADCAAVEAAILAKDFERLGEVAEANALAMHATMLAARPRLSYLKPASWAVLERVWAARNEGRTIFATMDAGANVKLIFLEDEAEEMAARFPEAQIIAPFDQAPAPETRSRPPA
ncbi:MAG: diphosphomevalonate decarboxylase [Pseudomonadota bacterium]